MYKRQLSGNAQYRNYDWYSGMNDPTYWADTAYAVLGTQQSAIVGYSIVNERLATDVYKRQMRTWAACYRPSALHASVAE